MLTVKDLITYLLNLPMDSKINTARFINLSDHSNFADLKMISYVEPMEDEDGNTKLIIGYFEEGNKR